MHDSMFCTSVVPLHALKAHVKGVSTSTCVLSACKGCFTNSIAPKSGNGALKH